MKITKEFLKKFLAIVIVLAIGWLELTYESRGFNGRTEESVLDYFSRIGTGIKEVPISIPYIIISLTILYFLLKMPFFSKMQISGVTSNDKRQKSTVKEIRVTIIFGLLICAFIGGLTAIIFKGTS